MYALLPLPEETKNEDDPWDPKLKIEGEEIQKYAERKEFLNAHSIIPIWYPCGKAEEAFKAFIKKLKSIAPEHRLSVTAARSALNQLINDGNACREGSNTVQAYDYYVEAERIIKRNYLAFKKSEQIDALEKLKEAYVSIGCAFDRKETVRELAVLNHDAYVYHHRP